MDSQKMLDEIERLQSIIEEKENEIKLLKTKLGSNVSIFNSLNRNIASEHYSTLNSSEIERYSRQIILPEINMNGQIALKNTSVLIVGAGGLGCPAGIYLSSAGIGKIGIVDHDIVEKNNLHRQIAHTEESIGVQKCNSFVKSVNAINSSLECKTYPFLLNSCNIKEIISEYDIIVDATDNVPTRYLLNDAAVLFNKPLVSGAALKFEGQLTVYNYEDGPCYRCLFPHPPATETTTNCSDSGVLGVVTGVIGCLQALEVIKIAVGLGPSYNKKMLLFDGVSGEFRNIKLRGKKSECKVCGDSPEIKDLIDYELFCNARATDKEHNLSLLASTDRISCEEYKKIMDNNIQHILIDVRPSIELNICHLPGSINIPFKVFMHQKYIDMLEDLIRNKKCCDNFVICRRGNDSQKAVLLLQKCFGHCRWRDIKGGLYAWHKEIDSALPLY